MAAAPPAKVAFVRAGEGALRSSPAAAPPAGLSAQSMVPHADFARFEQHSGGYGLRIMAKMGFRGRLGKREDGVLNPVLVRSRWENAPKRGLAGFEAHGAERASKRPRRREGEKEEEEEEEEEVREEQREAKEDSRAAAACKPSERPGGVRPSLNGAERVLVAAGGPPLSVGAAQPAGPSRAHPVKALLVFASALSEEQVTESRESLIGALREYFEMPEATDLSALRRFDVCALSDREALAVLLEPLSAWLTGVGFDVSLLQNDDDCSSGDVRSILELRDARLDAATKALRARGGAPPMVELRALLNQMKQLRWRVAFLHASSRERANTELAMLGLAGVANAVVTGQSLLSQRRPYTELCAEAARRLQLLPHETLVLCTHPLQALDALAAGFAVIFSPTRGGPFEALRFVSGAGAYHLQLSADASLPAALRELLRVPARGAAAEDAALPPLTPAAVLAEGARCFGVFSADHQLYACRVSRVCAEEGLCEVVYEGFGNEETLPVSSLALQSGEDERAPQANE